MTYTDTDRTGHEKRLIFCPAISPDTLLHLNIQGESYALRNFTSAGVGGVYALPSGSPFKARTAAGTIIESTSAFKASFAIEYEFDVSDEGVALSNVDRWHTIMARYEDRWKTRRGHEGGEPPEEAERFDGFADTDRRYDSLTEAFADKRTSLENQPFIRRIVESIGVAALFEREGYIKAVRLEGGPDLRIFTGYTNGFQNSQEIVEAVGNAHLWRSKRRTVLEPWGVDHPDHGTSMIGTNSKSRKVEGGLCAECSNVLPLSGVCNFC